jgi:hypothetical protein
MVWKLPICIVAALALTPIVSFASSAPVGKASRAPMLTRAPEFDLSRYHLRASLGVAWPSPQRRLTRSGRFGFDVGLGSPLASAEPASQREAAHTRAIVIDAGLAARAQGEPHRPGDADNVEGFGGLAAFASKEAPAPPADLGNRLLQVGAVQMMRDALSRQDGAPSTLGPAEKVAEGRDVFRKGDDPQLAQEAVAANSTARPAETAPPSASAPIAQYSARDGDVQIPKNGGEVVVSANLPAASSAGARSFAFDASEGTVLDPLLNTTYDLNSPKVVPSLK